MHAQFTTDAVTKYLENNVIEIQQPSQYDYGQNGNGESVVKIIQDGTNKLLYRVSKDIPHTTLSKYLVTAFVVNCASPPPVVRR